MDATVFTKELFEQYLLAGCAETKAEQLGVLRIASATKFACE
jgi:hypothetical protein